MRLLPRASLVGAFLLGVAAWLAMRVEPTPESTQPEEATWTSRRPDSAALASAWVDDTLSMLRTGRVAEEKQPATMEEFLAENRKNSEKWRKERNEELDQIVREARSMRGISDPLEALRAVRPSQDGYLKELAIFQYWLETDTEAALAEMGRNWRLLGRDDLPALLERKFGIDWLNAKIADENMPCRLRTALARELGLQMAHGQRLTGLLKYYNSATCPRLRILMAWDFAQEMPHEDPESAARFLSGNVPKELRELLIEQWKYLPSGENTMEEYWVRDLLKGLGVDASDYVVPTLGGYWGMDMEASIKLWEARKSMTFDEVVRDMIKEGSSPEKAVGEAIRSKVHHALADGPNWIEMFGEGQLTREELLNEMRREIPGSDVHPDALDREVWRRTAWAADPQEIAQWAAELSRRGDMDELITGTFTPSNIHGDPRILLRLARYHVVTQGLSDGRPRDRILNQAAYEWTRWQVVSPALAEAWLNKLPQNEPMHAVIRERDALERQRRENP